MLSKKFLSSSVIALLVSFSTGCAGNVPVAPTLNQISAQQVMQASNSAPVMPKVTLKIKKAEIQVSEKDLNEQLSSILAASDEKRIQDTKMTVLPGNLIKVGGRIAQKVPLTNKILRIPFTMEGKLSIQKGNIIKFEPTQIKVANLTVKAMMDLIGLELTSLTKFKDSFGRIELKGNSIFLVIEKFTDDVNIEGQMTSLRTEDSSLTVIF